MKEEEKKAKSVVTFVVGPYRFCIPATEVLSVITEPAMSKLPCSAGSVEGVFDYHGKVATSLSLRRKLRLEDRIGESDVWIVSRISAGLTAFRVDKIIDLVATDSLQWQQISTLSHISAVDKFALSDKEVFLSSNCESLFAMPDMSGRTGIVNDHDAIEDDEAKSEMHMPGQFVTDTKRDDNPVSCTVGDDTVVMGESTDESADFETGGAVTVPRGQKYIVSTDSKCDDQPLKPEPLVFSKEDSHQNSETVRHRPQHSAKRMHLSRRPAKRPVIQHMQEAAHRRIVEKKSLTIREMLQDNHNLYSARKHRFFGLTMFLGIGTVVVVLLCVFLFWPSDKKDRTHPVYSSPAFNEVTSYRNGSAVPEPTYHGSSVMETEDGRPENTVTPSIVQPEIVSFPKPATDNKINDDNDKKNTLHDCQESKEVLRVETTKFTVTVERPATFQIENRKEVTTMAYPEKGITHTVVKGDTLWDVAEHYLGDPFRYPELAAVSHIRDPDWIYPGDIIRIIKK